MDPHSRAGSSTIVLPAAAGQPILDLLTGALRPGTVIGSFASSVIVALDPPLGRTGPDDTPSRILAVVTADGSGVPHALRVAIPAAEHPFRGVQPGDPAFVGAGGVRLPGLEIRVVRSVRTQVPRVRCQAGAGSRIADVAAEAERGAPDDAVLALRVAQDDQHPAQLREAVRALVGLGSGSTPGGDDVLAGMLAGLHATGRDVLVQQVWVAARDRLAARTTLVSADLLRLAAAGHACAEAIAVLRATARPDFAVELDVALDRLLRVGHTSGADLATGLAIGLLAPSHGAIHQPRFTARANRWGGA
jgi:hypothetical protein